MTFLIALQHFFTSLEVKFSVALLIVLMHLFLPVPSFKVGTAGKKLLSIHTDVEINLNN